MAARPFATNAYHHDAHIHIHMYIQIYKLYYTSLNCVIHYSIRPYQAIHRRHLYSMHTPLNSKNQHAVYSPQAIAYTIICYVFGAILVCV